MRYPPSRFVGGALRCVASSSGLLLYWQHILVARALPVATATTHTNTTHTKWRCECGRVVRNQKLFVHHAQALHNTLFVHAASAGAITVFFTGDVRTNERRTRLPWRVEAPESE